MHAVNNHRLATLFPSLSDHLSQVLSFPIILGQCPFSPTRFKVHSFHPTSSLSNKAELLLLVNPPSLSLVPSSLSLLHFVIRYLLRASPHPSSTSPALALFVDPPYPSLISVSVRHSPIMLSLHSTRGLPLCQHLTISSALATAVHLCHPSAGSALGICYHWPICWYWPFLSSLPLPLWLPYHCGGVV